LGIAFAVLVLSVGRLNIPHAEQAASPNEPGAAGALDCFETWLDRPADFIEAVECVYRAWQIASCNHSKILTASLVKIVVRDLIMHVLVWMWEFGIPDAIPETPRYADSIAKSPLRANSLAEWRDCGAHTLSSSRIRAAKCLQNLAIIVDIRLRSIHYRPDLALSDSRG
jgi:hypothetical protein